MIGDWELADHLSPVSHFVSLLCEQFTWLSSTDKQGRVAVQQWSRTLSTLSVCVFSLYLLRTILSMICKLLAQYF